MNVMLKLIDAKLLSGVEDIYLHLLDRYGVLKGDALAALVILHLALSPVSVSVIGFKLVCLVSCLQLSSLQRSQQLRRVNALAEWLRGLVMLRMMMVVIAAVHVVDEPTVTVAAAQIVALGAVYLFCAKVRERRLTSAREGALRFAFAR